MDIGISAILLAAGSAKRMGKDKLLLDYRTQPIILHPIQALAHSRFISELVIVVRPGFELPAGKPHTLAKRMLIAENHQHAEGMGSSIRRGIEAASNDSHAYMLILADMPEVDGRLIDRLVDAFCKTDRLIVAPTYQGRRGHPLIVSAELKSQLLNCKGDMGLRSFIRDNPEMVEAIPLDNPSCIFDIDRGVDLFRGERVWIKGGGEHASATAHRLFRSGFPVIISELARPTAIRRRVSFCSAIYEGEIEIEGVWGRRHELPMDDNELASLIQYSRSHIPVIADDQGQIQSLWRPSVIIDGRILKKNIDNSIRDADLTIGYGPGLRAGVDVHVVVETMRGHDLGRIIWTGEALPNTGVPGELAGESSQRVIFAPASGRLEVYRNIGEIVTQGDLLARIDTSDVKAQISGVLRGIAYPGLMVKKAQKIGDIDPRRDPLSAFSISDKARCISGSALEIMLNHFSKDFLRPEI